MDFKRNLWVFCVPLILGVVDAIFLIAFDILHLFVELLQKQDLALFSFNFILLQGPLYLFFGIGTLLLKINFRKNDFTAWQNLGLGILGAIIGLFYFLSGFTPDSRTPLYSAESLAFLGKK